MGVVGSLEKMSLGKKMELEPRNPSFKLSFGVWWQGNGREIGEEMSSCNGGEAKWEEMSSTALEEGFKHESSVN